MRRTLLKHGACALVFAAAAFGAAALVQAPQPAPLADTSDGEKTDVVVTFPMTDTNDPGKHSVSVENTISSAKFEYKPATITGTGKHGSYAPLAQDENGNDIVYMKIKVNNTTNDTEAKKEVVKWTVAPVEGMIFTPTRVSAWIQRFGTDSEDGVKVTGISGDNQVSLGTFTALRSGKDLTANDAKAYDKMKGVNKFDIDLTVDQQKKLTTTSEFTLQSTIGVGKTKEGGFSDVRIYGYLTPDPDYVKPLPKAEIAWSSDKAIEYRAGDEIPAMPTFDNKGAYEKVTFSSTNEEIATVDNDGVVTAYNTTAGTANISATVEGVEGEYQSNTVSFDIKVLPRIATATFSLGEDVSVLGVAPEAVTVEEGKTITIPANYTVYSEGKTLVGWTDGETTANVGKAYTVNTDITLTPVFADNKVSLADREGAITLKWDFQKKNGAPIINGWQNKDNLVWVTQVKIKGETIDVALPFSTNPGKFANMNWEDWAQLNKGTKFLVPSCKGAAIYMETYSEDTPAEGKAATTFNGNNGTPAALGSNFSLSYNVEEEGDVNEVVIGERGSYYRFIQITLPGKYSEVYEWVKTTSNETAQNEVITWSEKHSNTDVLASTYTTTITTVKTPAKTLTTTKALKTEGATDVILTTTQVSDIVIVQSLTLHPTSKPSFDGVTMTENNAKIVEDEANNVRIFTLYNVEAGEHHVKKDLTDGLSGTDAQVALFYIGVGYLIEQPLPVVSMWAEADHETGKVIFKNVNEGDDVLHFTVEGMYDGDELKKHSVEGTQFDINGQFGPEDAKYSLAPATVHTITPYVNGVAGEPIKVLTKPVPVTLTYTNYSIAKAKEEGYTDVNEKNIAQYDPSYEMFKNFFVVTFPTVGEGVDIYFTPCDVLSMFEDNDIDTDVDDNLGGLGRKPRREPSTEGFEKYDASDIMNNLSYEGAKVSAYATSQLEDGTTLHSVINDITTIVTEVLGEEFTEAKVYDLNGREVKGELVPGVYVVVKGKKAVKVVVR